MKKITLLCAGILFVLVGFSQGEISSCDCNYATSRLLGYIWAGGSYNGSTEKFVIVSTNTNKSNHIIELTNGLGINTQIIPDPTKGWITTFKMDIDGLEGSFMWTDPAKNPDVVCDKKAFLASVVESHGNQNYGTVYQHTSQSRRNFISNLFIGEGIDDLYYPTATKVNVDSGQWHLLDAFPYVTCGRVPGYNCTLGNTGSTSCEQNEEPGDTFCGCSYATSRFLGYIWADSKFEKGNEYSRTAYGEVRAHLLELADGLGIDYTRSGSRFYFDFDNGNEFGGEDFYDIDPNTNPYMACDLKAFLASVVEGEGNLAGQVYDDGDPVKRGYIKTAFEGLGINTITPTRNGQIKWREVKIPKVSAVSHILKTFPYVNCGRVPGGTQTDGVSTPSCKLSGLIPANLSCSGPVIPRSAVDAFPEEDLTVVDVSPNPFVNELAIAFKTEGTYEVMLIDLSGRVVKQEVVNSAFTLNTSDLNAGFYVLNIVDENNNSHIQKLIKQW